jgi:predicted esterase
VLTRYPIVAAGLLTLTLGVVPRRGQAADLGTLLKGFFESAGSKDREAAIAQIVAAAPDPLDVERGLRHGRAYPADVKKGWQEFQHIGLDANVRPYHAYVPRRYAPERKHVVVVSLHGVVSAAELPSQAMVRQMRDGLARDADAQNTIAVIPLGQKGATWFDRVGMANVLDQLAAVKRRYNVDEDRVFVAGFSDGASGGLLMGLFHPTPWAGIIALSGSVTVASFAPYDAFPANLARRPIVAASGGVDPLYPAALQKRFIDQINALGGRIDWTGYPASGHDASYVDELSPKLDRFVETTRRDPAPRHIVWEAADPEVGRCDWVRIDEVRDVGNNRGPEPSNLTIVGPARFAFDPDKTHAGPGVRVRQIPAGSLARSAGLRPDDVLTRLDGVEITTMADARSVLLARILAMKRGDVVRGEYRRGDETRSFEVEIPDLPRSQVFKRRGPAGRIEVHADGNRVDVTARSVARYTLLIRRGTFDLDRPIQVVTNGRESFHDRVHPDLAFMLQQAAVDDDRSAVYCARIEVRVNPGRS